MHQLERTAIGGAFLFFNATLVPMRANEIATQFERLSPVSQRLVAELIAHLGRPADAVSSWEEVAAPGRPTEAILLPALNTDDIPTAWPENRFMDPYSFGMWADRADAADSTEYVRHLRREQWG